MVKIRLKTTFGSENLYQNFFHTPNLYNLFEGTTHPEALKGFYQYLKQWAVM